MTCSFCPKQLQNRRSCRQHERRLHITNDVGKNFESNVPKTSLFCSFCRQEFSNRQSTRNHERKVHLKVLKHCFDACGRFYTQKAELLDHIRTHFDRKDEQCSICLKSFKTKSVLRVHERNSHNSLKKFKCDACRAEFKQKSNLTVHLKIHRKQNDFHCTCCSKGK